MLKVYKYYLGDFAHKFELGIPLGGRILKLDTQRGTPVMWVLVNPDSRPQTRKFLWVETGSPMAEPLFGIPEYIGTIMNDDETYVHHLFEY